MIGIANSGIIDITAHRTPVFIHFFSAFCLSGFFKDDKGGGRDRGRPLKTYFFFPFFFFFFAPHEPQLILHLRF